MGPEFELELRTIIITVWHHPRARRWHFSWEVESLDGDYCYGSGRSESFDAARDMALRAANDLLHADLQKLGLYLGE